ncbi:MAG: rhodanese-like domain-containing protein [Nitriliruptor sp.]
MSSTTVGDLVRDARSRIRGLTPSEVEAHTLGQESILIDVREPEELDDQGLIAGAFHVPRGLLEFWADPTSPSHRPMFDPARTTIVYCAAGSRSALAAAALLDLGYRDVAHLDGGIQAWEQAGLPVAGLESWHR